MEHVMEVELFTPQVLIELYRTLPAEKQAEFRKCLARTLTNRDMAQIMAEMPRDERRQACAILVEVIMPFLISNAVRLVRENPSLSNEAIEKKLASHAKKFGDDFAREAGDIEREKLKIQRDRKSDPRTVRRNVEICDRRRQDTKRWTFGRLAREYEITRQAIVRILKEEDKWRRLAAQL
jgi:hypothetical protein